MAVFCFFFPEYILKGMFFHCPAPSLTFDPFFSTHTSKSRFRWTFEGCFSKMDMDDVYGGKSMRTRKYQKESAGKLVNIHITWG